MGGWERAGARVAAREEGERRGGRGGCRRRGGREWRRVPLRIPHRFGRDSGWGIVRRRTVLRGARWRGPSWSSGWGRKAVWDLLQNRERGGTRMGARIRADCGDREAAGGGGFRNGRRDSGRSR